MTSLRAAGEVGEKGKESQGKVVREGVTLHGQGGLWEAEREGLRAEDSEGDGVKAPRGPEKDTSSRNSGYVPFFSDVRVPISFDVDIQ